jgi:hypothetical protein
MIGASIGAHFADRRASCWASSQDSSAPAPEPSTSPQTAAYRQEPSLETGESYSSSYDSGRKATATTLPGAHNHFERSHDVSAPVSTLRCPSERIRPVD